LLEWAPSRDTIEIWCRPPSMIWSASRHIVQPPETTGPERDDQPGDGERHYEADDASADLAPSGPGSLACDSCEEDQSKKTPSASRIILSSRNGRTSSPCRHRRFGRDWSAKIPKWCGCAVLLRSSTPAWTSPITICEFASDGLQNASSNADFLSLTSGCTVIRQRWIGAIRDRTGRRPDPMAIAPYGAVHCEDPEIPAISALSKPSGSVICGAWPYSGNSTSFAPGMALAAILPNSG
jgi:hypothetical protein